MLADLDDNNHEQDWERGVADSGRDAKSRLVTVPWAPQFKRFIPRYLDHASVHAPQETEEEGQDEEADDSNSTGKPTLRRKLSRTPSGVEDPMQLMSSRNLMEAGNIKIVDITKKRVEGVVEEGDEDADEEGNFNADTGDDSDSFIEGDGSLMFPERPTLDESQEATAEMTTTTTADEAVSSAKEEADDKDWSKDDGDYQAHHNIMASPLSYPPDCSCSASSTLQNRHAGIVEYQFDGCVHVKAEGSRNCTLLLTATHMILEFDMDAHGLFEGEELAIGEETSRRKMLEDEEQPREEPKDGGTGTGSGGGNESNEQHHRAVASMRPRAIKWNLSELSHVYLRRYRLRDSALEMFFLPSGGSSFGGSGLFTASASVFLDFGPGREGNLRRDDAANCIMKQAPPQAVKQWPERSSSFLHEQLSRLASAWVEGRISNFEYLLHLNVLAGRSYNDLCQYPVMPWVLSNYTSMEIPDLNDISNYRDLSKPMGALNEERLEEFLERFETFQDPTIPPFMYGSHYSTSAGVVLHFNVRLHPYAGLHRQLQGGHFDVADRLFSSVPRTWEMCTGQSAAEVKELTPEWYCNPSFLKNSNDFKLGISQDGELLDNVVLPPWARGNPDRFIEVMRYALESDVCSSMLPDWIDLIFGRKQQGPEAIKANNVFFYLTYYGSVDVASIEDEALRAATELQIAHFGQCPMQLFWRPHVRRTARHRRDLSFFQTISAFHMGVTINMGSNSIDEADSPAVYLPFFSAPLSHWVHLDAPPPGPHAALVAVRLAGTDRCLTVDAKGVYHSFRWAWKAEENHDGGDEKPHDAGCFVAQRELPNFRAVPRLPYAPAQQTPGVKNPMDSDISVANVKYRAVVAISKTLFSGRTLVLVLSDGDGRGALALQLVDPYKGVVKGETLVPSIHSARITCIATDTIGAASGQGGVGGELAIVGSADGGASLWRFISSQFLPLRPRLRMRGHNGRKIHAVAISSLLNVCVSVSDHRCCVFHIGNGALQRAFSPACPLTNLTDVSSDNGDAKATITETTFADAPSVCLSAQGYIVLITKTTITTKNSKNTRTVISLNLYSLEGIFRGSRPLESWRGVPHKISATPDGTAVMVCSGRGVTIHRISCIQPLEFIDEWHITEEDNLDSNVPMAFDVDFGPSATRPVVAAAACSSGALRLHALSGISAFAEKYRKNNVSAVVGSALAKPARTIKSAVGKGLGLGSRVMGFGKEIGREAISDVKEKFSLFGRKNSSGGGTPSKSSSSSS